MRTRLQRAALVAALCVMGLPAFAQQRAFEDVVAQLKSPDAGARLDALRMLAESGYPEAGPPIAQLLRDPEERVQREALYAELGLYLGQPFGGRKRLALVMETRDAFAAQRAFDAGWAAVPVEPVPVEILTGLLTPMRSPNLSFRIEATYGLGVLGQVDGKPDAALSAIVDGLAERLGDPEPAGRLAAARAAGRIFRRCLAPCAGIGADRLGDALVHSLNDPEIEVQTAAMEALGEIRYERAVQALTGLYTHYKKDQPALIALDAIARIGHASSLPLFTAALSRRELDARRAAIEGIGRVGDKTALATIEGMRSGKRSPNEVLAVAFALERAGRGGQVEAIIQATAQELTREQAQDYLVELGRPAAAAVAAALPSATPGMRIALLQVLAVTGARDQAAVVEPFTRDRDERVAAAADRALRRLRRR